MTLNSDQSVGVWGNATYVCPREGAEWTARAVKFPANFDPAAPARGDDCPMCGVECDQVIDWEPDALDQIQHSTEGNNG